MVTKIEVEQVRATPGGGQEVTYKEMTPAEYRDYLDRAGMAGRRGKQSEPTKIKLWDCINSRWSHEKVGEGFPAEDIDYYLRKKYLERKTGQLLRKFALAPTVSTEPSQLEETMEPKTRRRRRRRR